MIRNVFFYDFDTFWTIFEDFDYCFVIFDDFDTFWTILQKKKKKNNQAISNCIKKEKTQSRWLEMFWGD